MVIIETYEDYQRVKGTITCKLLCVQYFSDDEYDKAMKLYEQATDFYKHECLPLRCSLRYYQGSVL